MFKSFLNFIFPPKERAMRAKILSRRDSDHFRRSSEALSIRTLFAYTDPNTKSLIHSLKYDHSLEAAAFFAPLLWDEILEISQERDMLGETSSLIVTIIPPRRARMKTIGYDQCALLLSEIKKCDTDGAIHYRTDILSRVRETPPQTKVKTKQDRIKNISGVFKASLEAEGKAIILIDDITTTGSTLQDAERALLEAGALSVEKLAIAH